GGHAGVAREVGEHHTVGAFAGLLPVEFDLQRDALADMDQLRAVAAFNRHRDLLYAVAKLGDAALAGGEEVPAEAGDCQHRQDENGDISATHGMSPKCRNFVPWLPRIPPGGRDQRPVRKWTLGHSPGVVRCMTLHACDYYGRRIPPRARLRQGMEAGPTR